MSSSERSRLRFFFGVLGFVPVFLCGWFGWLQVLQAGELKRADGASVPLSARAAEIQAERSEPLPGPRGTIVDRHGAVLAMDCEAFEVRAELQIPRKAVQDCSLVHAWGAEIARGLADALCRDQGLADRASARAEHFARIGKRLCTALRLDHVPASGPLPAALPRRAEILVDRGVSVLSVVEALELLDRATDSLILHMVHDHSRVYPEREVTYGLIGYVEDEAVRAPDGRLLAYRERAPAGLEGLAELAPGAPGQRAFRVDSQHRPFFTGIGYSAAPPSRIESTFDLELQKAASRELERQALSVSEDGRKRPAWGALVLVEIATGDVLAAASWHRDVKHPRGAAFTPYQLLYEPGSIVKPLVFAYATEHKGLDWERSYDCSSTGSDHHCDVPEVHGRRVRDDHACGVLDVRGVLVNSSNIGSVKVGSLLDRDDWRRYLDVFGFERSLGLPMPSETKGYKNPKGWLPGISEAAFKKWTGSSYSIGYEHQVNALQMARAYLTMLSGCRRELRVVRAREVDGVRTDEPVVTDRREFSPATIAAVAAAMRDVITDEEGSTGRHVVQKFRDEGVELTGLVAGKTGTAKSSTVVEGKGKVEVRNASFVGFAPANAPRYLVVSVLQRDDSARFYGGSYAAPPAARLLLEALRLEERRRLGQEPQVSATPGSSGRDREVAETGQAGR